MRSAVCIQPIELPNDGLQPAALRAAGEAKR